MVQCLWWASLLGMKNRKVLRQYGTFKDRENIEMFQGSVSFSVISTGEWFLSQDKTAKICTWFLYKLPVFSLAVRPQPGMIDSHGIHVSHVPVVLLFNGVCIYLFETPATLCWVPLCTCCGLSWCCFGATSMKQCVCWVVSLLNWQFHKSHCRLTA